MFKKYIKYSANDKKKFIVWLNKVKKIQYKISTAKKNIQKIRTIS